MVAAHGSKLTTPSNSACLPKTIQAVKDTEIVCGQVLRFHFQGYFVSGISIARMLGMPTGQPCLLLVGKLDADVRV